jgi:hypothetical protein
LLWNLKQKIPVLPNQLLITLKPESFWGVASVTKKLLQEE